MTDMHPYATQAANALHWNPDVVYAQLDLETGDFQSPVFLQDNNLAGIKYVSPSANPGSTGPGRAASDGGYYAHYPSLDAGVQGYVNFVQANPRYHNVSSTQDAAQEAELLHEDGWATDPNYAQKILSIIGLGSNASGGNVEATPVSNTNSSKGSFASGNDIIGIIHHSLSLEGFDFLHPVNSIAQDAGAIALRVVLVLLGVILFIFGLVAVVEKVAPSPNKSGSAPPIIPI